MKKTKHFIKATHENPSPEHWAEVVDAIRDRIPTKLTIKRGVNQRYEDEWLITQENGKDKYIIEW